MKLLPLLYTIFFLFMGISISAQDISISPDNGQQGTSFDVTVTGSNVNWGSGTATTHCAEIFNGTTTIQFTGTVASGTNSFTTTINIPANAGLGAYDAQVYANTNGDCSGPLDGDCNNCFTVNPPPAVSIAPNTGEQGTSFSVTLTGTGTSWGASSTHCVQLTNGVETFSFSGTAQGSSTLTGMLNIPGNASAGNYSVTVFDDQSGACSGDSDGTCTDCFTVTVPPPPVIGLSVSEGRQGEQLSMTITGTNTTWGAGESHCAEFTNGTSTFSFTGTISGAQNNLLDGTVDIPLNAELGPYDVRVYNDNAGACSGDIDATCKGCFIVTMVSSVNHMEEASGFRMEFNPNPAQSSVQLRFLKADQEDVQLTIYDISGKVVLKKIISNPGAGTIPLDISDLQAGLFILEATQKDKNFRTQLIKQ